MKNFAQLLTLATIVTGALAVPSRVPSGRCAGARAVSATSFKANGVTIQRTTHACGAAVAARQVDSDYPVASTPVDSTQSADSTAPADSTPSADSTAPADSTASADSTAPADSTPSADSTAAPESTASADSTAAPESTAPADTNSGPRNVCLQPCTNSCSHVTGILPPVSDDCDTIESAVSIFFSELNSQTFVVQPFHMESLTFGTCTYFFENMSTVPLEECWEDFVSDGSAAGQACFPPHQPFSPEGLCTGAGGSWAMGATHS